MPYIIRKLPNKDLYKVINKDTKAVHSYGSTYENAIKQVRLLNMVDAGVPLKNPPQIAGQGLNMSAPIVPIPESEFETLTKQQAEKKKEIMVIKNILPDRIFQYNKVYNAYQGLVKDGINMDKSELISLKKENKIIRNLQDRLKKLEIEVDEMDIRFGELQGKIKSGNGVGTKKLLELFKGTGSVGKAAKKLGFEVVSLDFDPIYTPDIETDILKWKYQQYSKDNNYIPDFIWASPPCNTFSTSIYRLKERDTKTAEPKSDRAKEGTAILYKTLAIINFFKKLNPNLKYIIENPRGMMRMDKRMIALPYMNTTTYCSYGDVKYKPTNFWSNFPLVLKEVGEGKSCKNTINVEHLNSINDRYSIPQPLIKSMLEQMLESKSGGSIETDNFEESGIVSLPEFNGVKIDLPTYMYKRLPDINGNPPPYRYRLVIPITKSRNLSSRKAEISVGISQKPVSKPIVNIKENDSPPILEEFSPADRAKIRDYYYNVKANEKKNPDKIDKDDYDSKTRGLPCYLQKNCEKQGKVSGQNKKAIKPLKEPRQPKPPKAKRPRGRPSIDRRPINITNNDIISQIVNRENRDRTAIEKRVAEEEKQASKVAFEKGLERRRGRPKSIASSEPSVADSTDLLFKGLREQLQPKKASSASLSANSNLSDVDIDNFFKKFGKGSGAPVMLETPPPPLSRTYQRLMRYINVIKNDYYRRFLPSIRTELVNEITQRYQNHILNINTLFSNDRITRTERELLIDEIRNNRQLLSLNPLNYDLGLEESDIETEIIDDEEEIQTGGGIKKSNSNIKMANKWIEYVKSYASKNKMKYSDALKDPKCKAGYKTGGSIKLPASSATQEAIAEVYNESQLGANAGKKYISL